MVKKYFVPGGKTSVSDAFLDAEYVSRISESPILFASG